MAAGRTEGKNDINARIDHDRLGADSHDDRVLYVAATRARHGTVLV